MDSLQHRVTPGSPTPLTQVLCVSHTVGLFLHSWYAHYACCSDSLLLSSVIANNGALPFVFDESSMLSLYLMCSQAGRARWLCTAPLSCNPPPQPPLPTPYSVSVSCHFPSGMEPEGPYDLGRSSDRRFPVKKSCFPQYRNRSLDFPAGTRCMYLFHLLLRCAAWRPCCMRKQKKKKRLKPLATLKIKLILLKVLRKLCQSQLWFPWHATALHCTWMSHAAHTHCMLVPVLYDWLIEERDHKP